MKFHDASRCPSNTDVSQLDCVSSDGISMYSFFTTPRLGVAPIGNFISVAAPIKNILFFIGAI